VAREIYLISDLHIGGDAALDACEFEPELIEFLKGLAESDGDMELIVAGDMFGLWELTEGEGVEKLRIVLARHAELFDEFRRAGERIRITLIPGNHDYDLASDPAYVEELARYNIRLEPVEHVTRTLGGRKVWIEHGHQRDEFNRVDHFGAPYVTPPGFYITRSVVANAGRYAVFGHQEWLKDVASVQPNWGVPHWVFSNYFYREMSPLLRVALVPFLVLFGASAVAFGGFALEMVGILPTGVFRQLLGRDLGLFGNLFGMIFAVNAVVIALAILLAFPVWLIRRDVTRTLRRYGLGTTTKLVTSTRETYRAAARELFERDGEFAVFVYGHTHDAFVERVEGGVVLNTGTWLRKLTRIRSRFRMPDVYWPSYQLHCFKLAAKDGEVVISYEGRPKHVDPGLTPVERLSIVARRRPGPVEIPRRTVA
jgi:UDP-2,3-diacylglucosamine pyrophosphatase LpxH